MKNNLSAGRNNGLFAVDCRYDVCIGKTARSAVQAALHIIEVFLHSVVEDNLQIASAAFDNIDFASLMEVPLTTVNQPAFQIGEEAARQALFEIDNPQLEKKTITFEPQLIVRESTRQI